MRNRIWKDRGGWVASLGLLGVIVLIGGGLAGWKAMTIREAAAAAADQPEPMEVVSVAEAAQREYGETTTSVGTVLALRSITLRNELAGTVRRVSMVPGDIVEAGAVLVALDVSVEEADLRAQEAQAELAQTTLERLEKLLRDGAASREEVDQARAERDVALAQMERTRAIIEKKTIRAPFRARVGIADVHPGQYLNEGTLLTTLQGVADAAHVDFAVSQQVAASLREGQVVQVVENEASRHEATIVAIDSRVDPTTRNAMIRARISDGTAAPSPGSSVRVVVPTGPSAAAVAVPVNALRKGPSGDFVFVLEQDAEGATRAHVRTVRTGPVVGGEVLVLEGLAPGERVAASGSFKLREGVLVAVSDGLAAAGLGR